jgi:hypothetical protein
MSSTPEDDQHSKVLSFAQIHEDNPPTMVEELKNPLGKNPGGKALFDQQEVLMNLVATVAAIQRQLNTQTAASAGPARDFDSETYAYPPMTPQNVTTRSKRFSMTPSKSSIQFHPSANQFHPSTPQQPSHIVITQTPIPEEIFLRGNFSFKDAMYFIKRIDDHQKRCRRENNGAPLVHIAYRMDQFAKAHAVTNLKQQYSGNCLYC